MASEPLDTLREVVALDDGQLDRARTQWQFGDWHSLAGMQIEDIADHAERARLALLAAAGHQQLGNHEEARRFTRQALAWGCNRRLVSQVLIAGVHNTLGRAHALLDPQGGRSLRHFEESIAVAQPGQDLRLLAQARAGRQLGSLDLQDAPPAAAAFDGPDAELEATSAAGARHAAQAAALESITAQLAELAAELKHARGQTEARLDGLDAALAGLSTQLRESSRTDAETRDAGAAQPPAWLPELRRMREQLESMATKPTPATQARALDAESLFAWRRSVEQAIGREVKEATRMVVAHLGLSHFLAHGKSMPAVQGWPLSADLGMWLVERLQDDRYDAVIEFGSGVSTMLMARALRTSRATNGRAGDAPLQLALEHLAPYHASTSRLLAEHKLQEQVRLVLAPLVATELGDGRVVDYYDCAGALADLAQALARRGVARPRLLVLVDGPPAATGPQARYPALGALREAFATAAMDIVMDDYARADEQQVLARWVDELKADQRVVEVQPLVLERGGCLLCLQEEVRA